MSGFVVTLGLRLKLRVSGSSCIGSQVEISVEPPFHRVLRGPWLRTAVESALSVALAGGQAGQVSLAVTGDDAVRRLNRDYRGLDEVTDVLSFSSSHPGQWEGENNSLESHHDTWANEGAPTFVYPPGEAAPLGEVIISYHQAQRQASQRGVPVDRELAQLIVHGVLHLTGHDHLEPQEEADMQTKALAALELIPEVTIAQIATA